jgi:Zonular occludens toxin (Zot)
LVNTVFTASYNCTLADNTFITAAIGGGKSLLATRVICNELAESERFLSVSVPLYFDDHWYRMARPKGSFKYPPDIPSWWLPELRTRDIEHRPHEVDIWVFGLATWCHYEIEKPVDVLARVRLLAHEEVSKFYLHLPGRDLPELTESIPGRKPVLVPDLTKRDGDGGCVFVIDEVHNYFSARNYLEAGPGVERYQSQLRKLGDDLWMISQHLEKVDKNFRRNATKTYEIYNVGHRRLWAGVSLPERFQWRQYVGVPQRGDKPQNKGSFDLRERGMCYLYDTMAGVGVSGGIKADKPPKGRHWSVWVLIAAAICIAAYVLPRAVMHGFGWGMGHMLASVQSGVSNGLGVNKTQTHEDKKTIEAKRPAVAGLRAAGGGKIEPEPGAPPDRAIVCRGYFVSGATVSAFLSNGVTVSTSDGTLLFLTKAAVGTKYGNFPIESCEPEYRAGPSVPGYVLETSYNSPAEYAEPQRSTVTVIGQAWKQRAQSNGGNGFTSGSRAQQTMENPYQNVGHN